MHLASRDCQISMPDGPWWQGFVGKDCTPLALSTIINALVGLDKSKDIVETTSTGFLPSLKVVGEAFNDPGSYLWDQGD